MTYIPADHAPPMWDHQRRIFEQTAHLKYWALWCEQRTGKTRIILDTAAYQFETGLINALVVGAYPSNVHRNWVTEEIPAYLPHRIPYKAIFWRSGRAGNKTWEQDLLELMHFRGLAILTFNCEALTRSHSLWPYLQKFCHTRKVMAVADECFVSGTAVLTPDGDRPIEILAIGDFVTTPSGSKRIMSVVKRFTSTLVSVKVSQLPSVCCTPNHPFMTERGWVCAGNLDGETVVDHRESLRILRDDVQTTGKDCQILQSSMHREMVHEPAEQIEQYWQSYQRPTGLESRDEDGETIVERRTALCEASPAEKVREVWKRFYSGKTNEQTEILRSILRSEMAPSASGTSWQSKVARDVQQDLEDPYVSPSDLSWKSWQSSAERNTKQVKSDSERAWTHVLNTRWERAFASGTAAEFADDIRLAVEGGTRHRIGKKAVWLSNFLQGRFSLGRRTVGDRGRRKFPQQPFSQSDRCEERRGAIGTRVESVESIELASPVAVYDIHVEGDHRYYAGGMLVHNSNWLASPNAARSKRAEALGRRAVTSRIASGTPVDESPFDIFAQCHFLHRGILGFEHALAFRNHYGEYEMEVDKATGEPIIDTDTGMPRRAKHYNHRTNHEYEVQTGYRNLEELNEKILSFGSRVLRSECADLPDKIYRKVHFDLAHEQRRAYDELRDRYRTELASGTVQAAHPLTRLGRLQMVTRGYWPEETVGRPCEVCQGAGCDECEGIGIAVVRLPRQLVPTTKNPAIEVLTDELLAIKAPVLVWCRYRWDVEDAFNAAEAAGRKAVRYDGSVKADQRAANLKSFQSGTADTFVGTAAVGGRGIRLDKADAIIYYSNSFSLLDRRQSEDRAESLTMTRGTGVIDLIARDTVDEHIVDTLRGKKSIAEEIMGDPKLSWI